MDAIFAGLECYQMTEIYWSPSEGLGTFLAYYLATRAMRDYPAKTLALLKQEKIDGGPVVPVLAPAVDANWLRCVAGMTASTVQRDYKRYPGVVDEDDIFLSEVSAEVADDLDDIFVQEPL